MPLCLRWRWRCRVDTAEQRSVPATHESNAVASANIAGRTSNMFANEEQRLKTHQSSAAKVALLTFHRLIMDLLHAKPEMPSDRETLRVDAADCANLGCVVHRFPGRASTAPERLLDFGDGLNGLRAGGFARQPQGNSFCTRRNLGIATGNCCYSQPPPPSLCAFICY